MNTLDRQKILDEVTAEWLPKVAKADREETKQLLETLVTSWLREAIGGVAELESVNEIQREDLRLLLTNAKTPAARIEALRGMVLRRRVNPVSAATFTLGKQVVDGEKDDATARAEAQLLQLQIDALAAEVNALGDSGIKRHLRMEISEMAMEVLYAIERKAMSLRLNRYQQTALAAHEPILDPMSNARDPEPPIVFARPEPREPEACFITAAWDRAEISDSLDGVRIQLEPGWTIRSLGDDTAWIVNENDPDRYEFAMQLRRVDLRAISPLDFLRLGMMFSHAQDSRSDLRWGSIEKMSPARWQSTASGHRRTAGFTIMGSPTRHWHATRRIDSDYDLRRVLITSPDERRGILIQYTDIAAIPVGRDEAERIVDSIEVTQHGRRSTGRADAIAASIRAIDSNPLNDGGAYLRLACALVGGRLFDEGASAFAVALSLMMQREAAPEAVRSAYRRYGFALLAAFRFRDAIQALLAAVKSPL